ncbi:DUF5947 family protein [Prauserella cavernicola]|uniref:Uncharacterized protein n=1 Tax=Prauserella cavernicola TaxID=2800127 RepID=A0A934QQN2_9PSEU|nr:DUF5947 family protein [Prauserella cavernicola]MBK1784956.1 hypothetical protein [Prauserella cavernicola]
MSTGLRKFLRPAPAARPGERCELCAEPIGEEHGHVIDLTTRAILCSCRGCYLLFTRPGAGGSRHRAVPERYRHVADLEIARTLWDSIGIPVRMAFVFENSVLERSVAFYPSPAGATESLLPLGAWDDLLAAAPGLADVEPDVEALLVNRTGEGFECFLVPIDTCYELVGLVRLYWRGFDGGSEARTAIEGFLSTLRERGEGGWPN